MSIAVSSLGPVTAGTLLWTQGGALRVTLVLRTAYALTPGALTPVQPEGVAAQDRHHHGDPARAVRTAADLAPRLPRAEVVHAGAVIAPAGVTMVRLALFREKEALFDKRAIATTKDDSPGFGPLGRTSPARRAALRGGADPAPDAMGTLPLSPDFDFGFYQSAPADQQVDRLMGGDQILLGNLHPELPELSVVVPSRAPTARALLGGEEAPLVLECKRVVLDTDARSYALVWYAELELPGFAAVPYLRIEARTPDAIPAAPPAQPQPPAPYDPRQILSRLAGARPQAPPSAPPAGVRQTAEGTVLLDPHGAPDDDTAATLLVGGPAQPHATGSGGTLFMDDPPAPPALTMFMPPTTEPKR